MYNSNNNNNYNNNVTARTSTPMFSQHVNTNNTYNNYNTYNDERTQNINQSKYHTHPSYHDQHSDTREYHQRKTNTTSGLYINNEQNFIKPQIIGRYLVGRSLGKGSSGHVFLGVDGTSGQEVAIKLLKKDAHNSHKIKLEIDILQSLKHSNIIKLLDVIELSTVSTLTYTNEETIALVFEYLNGGDLLEHISKNGRLTETQAKPIFKQLLEAVKFCHDHGVVHRDLKAENIIINHGGTSLLESEAQNLLLVKLIDFGLSDYEPKNGELMDTFCGSPHYLAPEMLLRQKYNGPKIDFYALGVLLYTMLNGAFPFYDTAPSELFAKIIEGNYQLPHHVSLEARQLIAQLMSKDPNMRGNSIGNILEHAWLKDKKVPVVPSQNNCSEEVEEMEGHWIFQNA